MHKVRLINGKGDWEASPPTGASDADLLHIINDIIDTGGVVDLAGGDSLVEELDTPGLGVKIAPGTIYVPNSSWIANSIEPKFYPVIDDTGDELEISSNPSGSTRIDLICQQVDKITTPNDDADNVGPYVVVEGTPGGGAPSVPTDHELLAEVEVVDGATSITNADITDQRRQIAIKEIFVGVPQSAILRSVAIGDITIAASQVYEIYGGNPAITISNPGIPVDIIADFTGIVFNGNTTDNIVYTAKVQTSVDGGSTYADGPEISLQFAATNSQDTLPIFARALRSNVTPTGDIRIRLQVEGDKISSSPQFKSGVITAHVVPRG